MRETVRKAALAASLGLSGLALGACHLTPPDKSADALAKRVISDVASGADLSKDAQVDPQMTSPESQAEEGAIRAFLPAGAPKSVKFTGFSVDTKAGEGARCELTYDYVYADRTVDITVLMRKRPGAKAWSVTGLQAGREGAGAPTIAGEQPTSVSPGKDTAKGSSGD
jgi:hypothetical protein